MKWKLVNIQATCPVDVGGCETTAHWEGMRADSDTALLLVNACSTEFTMSQVPCNMEALAVNDDTGIRTKIAKGAEAVVSAPGAVPWVTRLDSLLRIMESVDQRIVGVIDMPPPEHTYAAYDAISRLTERMTGVGSPTKMLMLALPHRAPCLQLQTSLSTRVLTIDTMPATEVKECEELLLSAPWTVIAKTADAVSSARLSPALSFLLGTYQTSAAEQHVKMEYPMGYTLPDAAAPYIVHSANTSIAYSRYSTTRGMALKVTDGNTASVSVILEGADDEEEDPAMQWLRQMLTSSDVGDIGSAYFKLHRMQLSEPLQGIVRRALRDTSTKVLALPFPPAPPSMMRNASHGFH